MGLQCGIIGITNIGKTTIFNCISDNKVETSNFAFSTNKSNLGQVKVPDARLKKIDTFINSVKIVPTSMEIIDIPGLAKGSSQGEGVGNSFLSDIRNCDALIHVIRCFDDENLVHIDVSIDPVRDKETIDFELQVTDLESVDKRIQKWERAVKTGDKQAKVALEVLAKCKSHLEDLNNLRTLDLKPEDYQFISELSLLTLKPVMFVCNVDDESAVKGNKYVDQFKAAMTDENEEVLLIAGKIESEITELEDEEDRQSFLGDLGLEEPGVNKLIRSAFSMLNLQTFFTAGPKEIKAWTIRKGMSAPEAAGVIHSDLQRGFIRAEVMKYQDFIKLGSESACRDVGKLYIEGKKYIVADGDILHIRFNV
ncbi:MAG: redox-regulated ATPase YchF [Bacteroidales bacterium]|nr:redox-regulated ATPase YchF [Bacteroidales bacterium]